MTSSSASGGGSETSPSGPGSGPSSAGSESGRNGSRSATTPTWLARRNLVVVLVGLGAGLLSGLFGVGGGVVLVPALATLLGLEHRRATATSLLAILPTAVVGALTYGLRGQVSLVAALVLLLGSLSGAQLGTWLLHRLPARVLPWIFVGFVGMVVVSQQVVAPVRDASLHLDLVRGAALVVVGLVAGVLSGLVGVGGGVVIVPGLELVVGVGDLLARGTSLAVMIPTAASGTVSNLRRGSADLRTGLLVGLASSAASPLGTALATRISPERTSWLFSVFLVLVVVSVLRRSRRPRR